ncbi:HNH endonuclease [Bacillus sp. 03113]|uniref:HNH endonuclease n=1 Tax=Bacillus sp. 03113 TaxID=2578211 RepID=UPI001143349A|nr:HNH endonuclease [Bacillus sp. 03113]
MPSKPLKPCNNHGCPNLTRERYCEDHKQLYYKYDQNRGTSAQRGYGARWRKYSQWFRKKNPICVSCRSAPSAHTDHITAVSGPNDPLFWDPTNHQALCHSCHSRKTVKEDGGFGNR